MIIKRKRNPNFTQYVPEPKNKMEISWETCSSTFRNLKKNSYLAAQYRTIQESTDCHSTKTKSKNN